MTTEIIGTIRPDGDRRAVRLERIYNTDIADLWSALTDPERLGRWFAPVAGELREGGHYEVVFDGDDPGSRTHGEIVECRPHHHLLVSWILQDEWESLVTLDLYRDGDGTRLVLEHRRLPAGAAAGYGAGWQTYLEQLEADLDGGDGHRGTWDDRWKELKAAYEAQLA